MLTALDNNDMGDSPNFSWAYQAFLKSSKPIIGAGTQKVPGWVEGQQNLWLKGVGGEANIHSLRTLVLGESYCRNRNEYSKYVCTVSTPPPPTHTQAHIPTHVPHNNAAGGIIQIFWKKRLRPQGTSCFIVSHLFFYDNLQFSSCGIHSELVSSSSCQETYTVLPGPTKNQPSKRLEQLSQR